jgi:hypothetical protein
MEPTWLRSNSKITEKGKFEITDTKIHDSSFSWLGARSLIKCGGVKLVLGQNLPSELNDV